MSSAASSRGAQAPPTDPAGPPREGGNAHPHRSSEDGAGWGDRLWQMATAWTTNALDLVREVCGTWGLRLREEAIPWIMAVPGLEPKVYKSLKFLVLQLLLPPVMAARLINYSMPCLVGLSTTIWTVTLWTVALWNLYKLWCWMDWKLPRRQNQPDARAATTTPPASRRPSIPVVPPNVIVAPTFPLQPFTTGPAMTTSSVLGAIFSVFSPLPPVDDAVMTFLIACGRLLLFATMTTAVLLGPFLVITNHRTPAIITYVLTSVSTWIPVRVYLWIIVYVFALLGWWCIYARAGDEWQRWMQTGRGRGRFTCRFCGTQYDDVCGRCAAMARNSRSIEFAGWRVVPEWGWGVNGA